MKKFKQTKRLAFILSLIMIVSTLFSATTINVSALKVGDEIGDVLNTDIKTYINGHRIPSYNIGGKTCVIIADLKNYGFESMYDNNTKTTELTFNTNKPFKPITDFNDNTAKIGSVAFKYLYTDIVAYVNGKKVESFNIKGNLAIYFSDLKDYGEFVYDNATRSSKITIYRAVLNYVGELKNDLPNGKGVMTWTNESKYDGNWKDGKFHGYGVWTWTDGEKYEKYEGDWNYGFMHGYGIYTWANGYKYEGAWNVGVTQGYGVLTSSNGDKYEGEWNAGSLWNGTVKDVNGKLLYEYKDGKAVKK